MLRSLLSGLTVLCALTLLPRGGIATPAPPEYDVVILNARVIDPESRLDAIRNIGITNGAIQAVSASSMRGRNTVLATGLVVSPGFIDLHSHGQDQENYRFKAIETFGTPELRSLLDSTGMGNHPEVVRLALKIGKAISEDTIVRGRNTPSGGAKDPASVLYGNTPT